MGEWVIFYYFSTGRKYPAVVYGSYISGLGYISMGGGGGVLLLPAWTGKNRSEWLLGVHGYKELWANGWNRSEGLLWLLRGIYGLSLLPVVGWNCGEGVVEILKHAGIQKRPPRRAALFVAEVTQRQLCAHLECIFINFCLIRIIPQALPAWYNNFAVHPYNNPWA